MIFFPESSIFLIFVITALSTEGVVQSSNNQNDEITEDNPGGISSTGVTESPTNSGDITRETKRQKIFHKDEYTIKNLEKPQKEDAHSKNEAKETPKISEIPESVLEFFNNPDFPDEDRLDGPASYEKSNNDLGKKSFEEFQKKIPFVIQREKFRGMKTIYFEASTLILNLLYIEGVRNPENENKLEKYLRDTKLSDNDFKRYNYYDWQFYSEEDKKRLMPACPTEYVENIEDPADDTEEVIPQDPTEMTLQPYGVFSSEEDNDTASPPASPQHSNSEISIDATAEPQAQLPPSSPTYSNGSTQTNQSPTRSKSSPGKKLTQKSSKKLNLASSMRKLIKKSNTFDGRFLEAGTVIEEDEFTASNFPCDYELKPSFIEDKKDEDYNTYYAGYVVDFGKTVTPLVENFLSLPKRMHWFHIAHILKDKTTKDTIAVFNYTTFYESVFQMENIPIYTDYTTNENSHADVKYFKQMYSIKNQKKVFEKFENHHKYFDPNESLVLVEQELMDQKSVAPMTHKLVAMDYMNIAPMYKIIKDNTWSKIENVILKLPMVTAGSSLIFMTGTYGALKIGDSSEGLYLDSNGQIAGIKRLKVPYAFYKIVHITYGSTKHGDSLPIRLKFFLGIVIVTHNDPFETNPKKICDKPVVCASIGWRKVEQKNPAFGFTYCCEFTRKFAEDMNILRLYDSVRTDELLDLRLLWYVEVNESTKPLERDEFTLIQKRKPVYENVGDS